MVIRTETLVLALALIAVAIGALLIGRAGLTGHAVAVAGTTSYATAPNATVRTGQPLTIALPRPMRVRSVLVSGTGVLASGEVSVVVGGRTYDLTSNSSNGLSGLVTGVISPQPETPLNSSRVVRRNSSNASVATNLTYGNGPYDVDNNGIVGPQGAVDFQVSGQPACVIWTVITQTASLFCRGNASCCTRLGFPYQNGSATYLALTRASAGGTDGEVLARASNETFSNPLTFSFAGPPERYVSLDRQCGQACSIDRLASSIEIRIGAGSFTVTNVTVLYESLNGTLSNDTAVLYAMNGTNGTGKVVRAIRRGTGRNASEGQRVGRPSAVVESSLLDALDRGRRERVLIRNASGVHSRVLDKAGFDSLVANGSVAEAAIDAPVSVLATDALGITGISAVQNATGLSGAGETVCVVDTGVNVQILRDANAQFSTFNVLDNSTNASDGNGHGTEVTDALLKAAPGATYVIVKAIANNGTGYESDVIRGLQMCAAQGANVVSLSIGSGLYSGLCDNNLLAQEANALVSSGTIVVAAAGNEGGPLLKAPACASNVTAVISTDANDSVAASSSYLAGHAILAAPGVGIRTLDRFAKPTTASGTSMAAPFVSGAAALLLENDSNLTPLGVRSLLVDTGAFHNTSGFAYSRLDLTNALERNYTNHLSSTFAGASQGNGSSNGTVQTLTNINTCQNITSAGSYSLTTSLSSAGTCLRINASNVVLNCSGYTINYSQSAAGDGINVKSGVQNTTIENCVIVQGSTSSSSTALNAGSGTNNGLTLRNLTVETRGTSSYGVSVDGSSYLNISRITATTHGRTAYAVYAYSVVHSNYSRLNLTTYGNGSNALETLNLASNDSFDLVNLTGWGGSNYGFFAQGFAQSTLSNSRVVMHNASGTGILGYGAGWQSNALFENVSITTTGNSGYGFQLYNSDYTYLKNLTIHTTGPGAPAYIQQLTENTSLTGFNITSDQSVALYLYGASTINGGQYINGSLHTTNGTELESSSTYGGSAAIINVSFDPANVSILAGAIEVGWYVNTYVDNRSGAPQSATVTYSDSGPHSSTNLDASGTFSTGSDGYHRKQVVYSYHQSSSGTYSYGPYVYTASKSGYGTARTSATITGNAQVNLTLLTLVSSCENIITPGAYGLSSDLSSTGACMDINASNVYFSCGDHLINYSQISGGSGIEVETGLHNVTIANCRVDQGSSASNGQAIRVSYGSTTSTDITVGNVSVVTYGNHSRGLQFENISGLTVKNATIVTHGMNLSEAFYFYDARNVKAYDIDTTAYRNNAVQIYTLSRNITINRMTAASYRLNYEAIGVNGPDVTIEHTNATNYNTSSGVSTALRAANAANNTVIVGSRLLGGSYGAYASTGNVYVYNSTLNDSSGFGNWIRIDNNPGDKVYFVNVTPATNQVSWFTGQTDGRFYYGWYVRAYVNDTSGTPLAIGVKYNDTSGNSALNPSATGTLLTHSNGYSKRVPIYQYTQTYNTSTVTSNFGNYTFNASHLGFTSQSLSRNVTGNENLAFTLSRAGAGTVCINETGVCYPTIGEAVGNATSGQTVVITDNGTYHENVTINMSLTLTQDSPYGKPTITSDGTAINVTSSNVTIDCRGMTINYSQTQIGHAIIVQPKHSNVAISNCDIVQGSSLGTSGTTPYAIYFYSPGSANRGYNNSVKNTNITTYGNYTRGLSFNYQHNFTADNLRIVTYGSNTVALRPYYAVDVSMSNLYLTTYGAGSPALEPYYSEYGSISSATVSTNGSNSRGIYIVGGSTPDWNITGATIMTNGSNSGGIYGEASNFRISNVSITTRGSGTTANGIDAYNAPDWTLHNVTINASGKGIYGYTSSYSWTMDHLNITAVGYGLYFGSGVYDWHVYNSTITSSGASDIRLYSSSTNKLYLLNVTFNESNVSFYSSSSGQLYVGWYLKANVTDLSQAPIQNALVSLSGQSPVPNPTLAMSHTGSDGIDPNIPVYAYVENKSGRYPFNDYTASVSASGYVTNSTTINVSSDSYLHLALATAPASVCVLETHACFTTIQAAIDNATSGQTVVITDNRTYYENVTINKSITLTQNSTSGKPTVEADGRVIHVNASDVTIDCAGMTINYSRLDPKDGLLVDPGDSNVAISHCDIVQGAPLGSSSTTPHAIYFYSPSTIGYNNSVKYTNITTYGNYSRGLSLSYQQNFTGENLRITTYGQYAYAIRPYYSTYSTFRTLDLSTNAYASYTMPMYRGSNITLSNANISVNGSNVAGIELYFTQGVNLSHLNVSASGTFTEGIYSYDSSYDTLTDSTISSSDSYGIYSNYGPNNHWTIKRVNITSAEAGIEEYQGTYWSVSNVRITSSWRGYDAYLGTHTNITHLTVNATGNYPGFRFYYYSQNIIVANSTIHSNGTDVEMEAEAAGTQYNLKLVNTTYNESNVSFRYANPGTLYKGWYVNVNVTNSSGSGIPGATILYGSANQGLNPTVTPESTNGAGLTGKRAVYQSMQNASTTINFNDYTISASKAGYTSNSTIVNVSGNKVINLTLYPSPAHVCVLETGKCFTTVQAAVDNATSGQTVVITDGGTYNENVTIGKPLTLTQNSTSGAPEIISLHHTYAIYVNASNVTIDCGGMTIETIPSASSTSGIYVKTGSTTLENLRISNCKLVDSESGSLSTYGIRFDSSSASGRINHFTISNVSIANFSDVALYAYSASGIRTYFGNGTVTDLTVTGPTTYDGAALDYADNVTFVGLNITQATSKGLFAYYSNDLWVYNSSITNAPSHVYVSSNSGTNVYLVNTMFNRSKDVVSSPGRVYIGWYVDAYVNSSVKNANVSWTDNGAASASNPSASGWKYTAADGHARNNVIYESYQTSSTAFTKFNNYTFNASKTGYYPANLTTNITSTREIVLNLSVIPSNCGTLSSDYTLATGVSSSGTCFTINASNVVLNCAGHTITYSTGGSGKGVYIDPVSNVTVENCKIVQGGSALGSENRNAVYVSGNSTYNSTGIIVKYSTLTTYDNSSNALSARYTPGILVSHVNARTDGNGSYGIDLFHAPSSRIVSPSAKVNGSSTHGIYLEASSDTNITGGSAKVTGSGGYGILASGSSNLHLSGMTITATGTNGRGASIESSSSNVTISGFKISATNTGGRGIEYANSDGATVSRTNVSTKGTSYGYALILYYANGANLTKVKLSTNGDTSDALDVQYSNDTTATDATVSTNGTSTPGTYYTHSHRASIVGMTTITRGSSSYALDTSGFYDSNVRDSSFTAAGASGWAFSSVNSTNDNFTHVTFNGSGTSAPGIVWQTGSSNQRFFNSTIVASGTDIDVGSDSNTDVFRFINTTYDPASKFWESSTGGTVLQAWYVDLYTENTSGSPITSASVNYSDNGAHQSANPTSTGSGTTGADGYIHKRIIYARTQNQSGVYSFNNYTFNSTASGYGSVIDQSENISSNQQVTLSIPSVACGNLTNDLILTANVYSSGTCFNIKSSNVLLDCAGYTINYSMSATGYGVIVQPSLANVTIENCKIRQGDSGGGSTDRRYGIYANSGSTIKKTSVVTHGNYATGIVTGTGASGTIENVNVSVTGTQYADGIDVYGNNWTITNSRINSTNGLNQGIYINGSNTSVSNTRVSGSFGDGILMAEVSGVVMDALDVTLTGAGSTRGIELGESGPCCGGGGVQYHAGTTIRNTNITMTSTSGSGLSIGSYYAPTNVTIVNVNVSTTGSSNAYGLYLSENVANVTLYNSTIHAQSSPDVYVIASPKHVNDYLVNTTYSTSSVTLNTPSNASLHRGWYTDLHVNATTGSPIAATVNYSDNGLASSLNPTSGGTVTTAANGYYRDLVLYEYSRDSTGVHYHTNYTFNVTASGYRTLKHRSRNISTNRLLTFTLTHNTCTPPGSGDWTVNLTDNCTVSGTVDIYPSTLILEGKNGRFTIASTGTLRAKHLDYTPSVFDGSSTLIVKTGGKLDIVK